MLKLADEIIVPQSVVEEIKTGHSGDPAEQIISTGQFPVAEIPALPEILAWDLGKGETAVLSYALANPTWTAIIDDQAARKCAKSFSIGIFQGANSIPPDRLHEGEILAFVHWKGDQRHPGWRHATFFE